ncbi:ABC transporter ATP-binding protein [Pseudothermotoga sp.]
MTALEIVRLTKIFQRDVVAVQNFSIRVQEGEFVTLLGPSGCGKTTVLRCIAGLERPTSGEIYIFGKLSNEIPPEKRDTAMVFQNYALFPNMTVAQNVAFPMKLKKMHKDEILEKLSKLFELVKLKGLEERYPYQLSGGQRQRAALIRALAKDPKILLLDEPLSALDAKIRQELRIELRKIQLSLGITTVYVTHDQEEALLMSDKIVVMNHGVIQQIGTPDEIYNKPANLFVATFIGSNNVFVGQLEDKGVFKWRQHTFRIHENNVRAEVGKNAYMVVRCHALSLRKVERFNCFDAKVGLVNFSGSTVKVLLRVEDEEIFAEIPMEDVKDVQLKLGDKVKVCFDPNSAWVFPGD